MCVRFSLLEQVNCHSAVALYEIAKKKKNKTKNERISHTTRHLVYVCCCHCVYFLAVKQHTHPNGHKSRACIHRRCFIDTCSQQHRTTVALRYVCIPAHATPNDRESLRKQCTMRLKRRKICFACVFESIWTFVTAYGCSHYYVRIKNAKFEVKKNAFSHARRQCPFNFYGFKVFMIK